MVRALRILVVDEDAIDGLMPGEWLRSVGGEVCAIAMMEADAMNAAFGCKPDLRRIDVRLRGQRGIAVGGHSSRHSLGG